MKLEELLEGVSYQIYKSPQARRKQRKAVRRIKTLRKRIFLPSCLTTER